MKDSRRFNRVGGPASGSRPLIGLPRVRGRGHELLDAQHLNNESLLYVSDYEFASLS